MSRRLPWRSRTVRRTWPEKWQRRRADGSDVDVTSIPANAKGPLTTAVSEPGESGRWDSNPRRPAWEAGQKSTPKGAKPFTLQQLTETGGGLQGQMKSCEE